ncbi:MAG: helix-turn-helix domain-containing protein [Oscillospiraceae bacterium]|nr:helix-turn-helix domain-containing protein [Oscillospiraceae bacterium]
MSSFYFCDAGTETALSASAYKVYHMLLSLANYQTGTSFPSKEYLSKQTGLSKSTVYTATKELVQCGLISVQERFNRAVGQQTSNLYTILKRPDFQPCSGKRKKLQIDKKIAQRLSGKALRVFCFLKANTSKDGVCGVHIRTIAQQLGKSIRTVQRYLSELAERGVLEIIGDKGKKSYYRIRNSLSTQTALKWRNPSHDDIFQVNADKAYTVCGSFTEQIGMTMQLLI